MVTRIWILGALLGILSLPLHSARAVSNVVPSAEAARTVIITDLTVKADSVSGTIVNKSSATVRGVELLLRQVWQWKDERHPGADSPGRTLPFTFQTPPLPQRSDGRFVTSMDVTGFTEVGP